MKITQCDRVLRHLRDYGTITSLEAVNEYGILRLASRINDLRRMGYPVGRRIKTSKNRYSESVSYAEYYLEEGGNA